MWKHAGNEHTPTTNIPPTVTHRILVRPLRSDNPCVRHRQGGC